MGDEDEDNDILTDKKKEEMKNRVITDVALGQKIKTSNDSEMVVSLLESDDEISESAPIEENNEKANLSDNQTTSEFTWGQRRASTEDKGNLISNNKNYSSSDSKLKEEIGDRLEVPSKERSHEQLLQDFLEEEGRELDLIEQEQALLYDGMMQRTKDGSSESVKPTDIENFAKIEVISTKDEKREELREGIGTEDIFSKGPNKENYGEKIEISESDQKAVDRLLELGQGEFNRKDVLRAYNKAKRNETDAASLLFLGEF